MQVSALSHKVCYIVAVLYVLGFPLLVGCDPAAQNATTGEQLAKTYCGSCHVTPSPLLLDKTTWRQNIMPVMAAKLGWDYIYEMPVKDSQPVLSFEDLRKLAEWYYKNAPDSNPSQVRPRITEYTHLFKTEWTPVRDGMYPSAAFIKIDPGKQFLYASNAVDSSFQVYDKSLQLLSTRRIGGTVIDMNFSDDLTKPGERTGVLTQIGIMNPNDKQTGFVQRFTFDQAGILQTGETIIDSLPRPVKAIATDLDSNGRTDYVVCGFGNTTGALSWHKPRNQDQLEKNILRSLPGAIQSYPGDFDHDGRLDVLVLMAQAQEGIYLLRNEGNDQFSTHEVLTFPVINGSSYFELADFNKDGFQDILYTCGDNADYSGHVLKNYHGLYIYLNNGRFEFSQKYFFAMHGCYKAIARDFDNDGDLDIASISFFPDEKNQPEEAFVYLEQVRPFQFTPYITTEFQRGRWLTMDVGDIDGDGDLDIALGSLIPPYKEQLDRWKNEDKQRNAAVMLLRNNTRK